MGIAEDIREFIKKVPNVKKIKIDNVEVELYPSKSEVQTSAMPSLVDIPPDDVMLFAATEDVDELMKQRKE